MSDDTHVRVQVKAELRKRQRRLRAALPASARRERSARIVEHVRKLPSFEAARVVASFMPMPTEVDLSGLHSLLLARGDVLALPRVDLTLDALALHTHDATWPLVTSPFGVDEPAEDAPPVAPNDVDLVLVPALAVDLRGFRLGYGKGYYDRLLPTLSRAAKVAVAFDFELVAELPTLPHDVAVDVVVTDRRVVPATRER